MKRLFGIFALSIITCLTLSACGVNNVPTQEQVVKAKWADVQTQYQRRADLIPNLVEAVKGYSKQEREVLTAVVEARAKATQVQIDASQLTDPEAFARFQQAQGQLGGVLGRLMAISESYPDLKSNQNFLALQSQIEGTENRISVARRDYNEAVRVYNTEITTVPGRWIAAFLYPGAKEKQMFEATTEGADQAPKVSF